MLALLIDISSKPVLIVGGGKVAYRKALKLSEEGAVITVVSPDFCDEFSKMKNKPSLIEKEYSGGDLQGYFMVIAATDDLRLNSIICDDAKENGILYTSITGVEEGSVLFQATLTRGDLNVSVSTGGRFAGLTKKIRDELEDYFPDDYGEYIEYLSQKRDEIKARKCSNNRDEINRLLEIDYNSYRKKRDGN